MLGALRCTSASKGSRQPAAGANADQLTSNMQHGGCHAAWHHACPQEQRGAKRQARSTCVRATAQATDAAQCSMESLHMPHTGTQLYSRDSAGTASAAPKSALVHQWQMRASANASQAQQTQPGLHAAPALVLQSNSADPVQTCMEPVDAAAPQAGVHDPTPPCKSKSVAQDLSNQSPPVSAAGEEDVDSISDPFADTPVWQSAPAAVPVAAPSLAQVDEQGDAAGSAPHLDSQPLESQTAAAPAPAHDIGQSDIVSSTTALQEVHAGDSVSLQLQASAAAEAAAAARSTAALHPNVPPAAQSPAAANLQAAPAHAALPAPVHLPAPPAPSERVHAARQLASLSAASDDFVGSAEHQRLSQAVLASSEASGDEAQGIAQGSAMWLKARSRRLTASSVASAAGLKPKCVFCRASCAVLRSQDMQRDAGRPSRNSLIVVAMLC